MKLLVMLEIGHLFGHLLQSSIMNGIGELLGDIRFAAEEGDLAGEGKELRRAHLCDGSSRRGKSQPHPQVMNTVTGHAQTELMMAAGLPSLTFIVSISSI